MLSTTFSPIFFNSMTTSSSLSIFLLTSAASTFVFFSDALEDMVIIGLLTLPFISFFFCSISILSIFDGNVEVVIMFLFSSSILFVTSFMISSFISIFLLTSSVFVFFFNGPGDMVVLSASSISLAIGLLTIPSISFFFCTSSVFAIFDGAVEAVVALLSFFSSLLSVRGLLTSTSFISIFLLTSSVSISFFFRPSFVFVIFNDDVEVVIGLCSSSSSLSSFATGLLTTFFFISFFVLLLLFEENLEVTFFLIVLTLSFTSSPIAELPMTSPSSLLSSSRDISIVELLISSDFVLSSSLSLSL
mmetsp:Transcript_54043/g.62426  ORF Transcript_54043/g.62426 Transcript_54043/m.62426 type:complete len:303 (+) Transcript_54043:1510-2418(+)